MSDSQNIKDFLFYKISHFKLRFPFKRELRIYATDIKRKLTEFISFEKQKRQYLTHSYSDKDVN